MSEKAAKTARREVRRAVGETTVGLIGEVVTAIKDHLYPTQHAHAQQLRDQEQRIEMLESQVRQLSKPD